MPRTRRATTLRRQLIAWLAGPLFILWSVSTVIDYDIAKRFVNLAYDRALLDAALDVGRQVKVLNDRVYLDLPEPALQILQTRDSGQLIYLVTGPDHEFMCRASPTFRARPTTRPRPPPTGCSITTTSSAAA